MVASAVIVLAAEIAGHVAQVVNERSRQQHEAALAAQRIATDRQLAFLRSGTDVVVSTINVIGSFSGRPSAAQRQRELVEERDFQRAQVARAHQFQRGLSRMSSAADQKVQERISKLRVEGAKELANYQRLLESA